MFLQWFINLRLAGVPVTLPEWLDLMRAMEGGQVGNLHELYGIGLCLLVKSENRYDDYDLAFSASFGDGTIPNELRAEFEDWLSNPKAGSFDPATLAALAELDPDELRRRFEEMLKEQKERHDGGSKYIGTGGTSAFGTGGRHPSGVRIGGGGQRSAAMVADKRRFQSYRDDAVLDVRQFDTALRMLRQLLREGPEELDIDESISATARQAGEIELVFRPARKNSIRLLLIMDVGGSMTAHAQICDRLFSAASKANHFKSFNHYWFHNCPYEQLWDESPQSRSVIPTADILDKHHEETCVIFVGDACMHPWELFQPGWTIQRWRQEEMRRGLDWVEAFGKRFKNRIWLNPEPQDSWNHPTIEAIGSHFPMFPMTLLGLKDGLRELRRGLRS
jgi:uncharacterized protein with von Willebrand factor type A (vWA) domain